MKKITVTKNHKIMLIKIMAAVVSTYHMVDVLSVYGMWQIATIAGLSLGFGEYMISQEYAVMADNNKLKKLMLGTLMGLSFISVLANIESFARHFNWSSVSGGYQYYYIWAAGIIYSVSMPAVIVTTSFIRLKDEKKIVAESEEKPEMNVDELRERSRVINKPKVAKEVNQAIRKLREKTVSGNGLDPEVQKKLAALNVN